MSFDLVRRKLLQSTGAAIGSFALSPWVQAQSSDAQNRHCLVIGNGNYKDSPLKNPVNDATAMGNALSALGFETQVVLNANLTDLTKSINEFSNHIKQNKAIGLFYYAGHGVQLGWRNYLIPVDAIINKLDDIPNKTVDLGVLLSGLSQANNLMNIVILDACRDNPFGKRVPPEKKGLSQFDAPARSLLSFATAPGHTASDGLAQHGLFTENLLREISAPEVRIEDVFKRVRLNVRLQSKGQQIPWESTSLESDFYFSTGKSAPTPGNSERLKQLNEELAAWESVIKSPNLALVEEYISKYPSGIYSQLALARLDVLLAQSGEKTIEIQQSADNPFTKGSASGLTKYAIGNQLTFSIRDLFTNNIEKTFTETVTGLSDEQVVFNGGTTILDRLGNEIKSPEPRFLTPAQFYPETYAIGKRWQTIFGWMQRDGTTRSRMDLEFKIVGREPFTTALGRVNAFIVEGSGYVIESGSRFEMSYRIDPDKYPCPVAFETKSRNTSGKNRTWTRKELIAFKN